MMPVDLQLAESRNAGVNAFVTNIPYSDDAGWPAACRIRECRSQCICYKYPVFRNAVLNAWCRLTSSMPNPGMPFSMHLLQISRIQMMPVHQQLAESRNAGLNAFVTNIPDPMMGLDNASWPDPGMPFSMHLLQISRIRWCRLTSSLPDPGMPVSMRLIQISRIRWYRLTSLIGSLPDPGKPFSIRLLQISRIQMMPVDQQLAGSRNAGLNAFVTNIPYSDDAG
jgi:hypothetical protein